MRTCSAVGEVTVFLSDFIERFAFLPTENCFSVSTARAISKGGTGQLSNRFRRFPSGFSSRDKLPVFLAVFTAVG